MLRTPLNRAHQVVAALGAGTDREARFYAELTGRNFRRFDSMADLERGGPIDVLVTGEEHLEPRLFELLYADSARSRAPGIITAADRGALHRQLLVRAAAARCAPEITARAIEVYPTLPFAGLQYDRCRLLGGSAPRTKVLEAFTEGADCITAFTHSDGIDAFLGPNLSICAMGSVVRPTETAREPFCRITGQCFRHSLPTSIALSSEYILRPERVRTRLFVWAVCSGVLWRGDTVDARYGLLPSLLANNAIGAVVTTWKMVVASPRLLAPLVGAIYAGASLGKAVARLNRTRACRDAGLQLAMFGDPDLRVFRPGSRAMPSKHPIFRTGRRSTTGAFMRSSDGSFTLPYLRVAAQRAGRDTVEPARIALARVDAYEEARKSGCAVETGEGSPGPCARDAVLDFISKRGTVISHDWLILAKHCRTLSATVCTNCGLQAEQRGYWFEGWPRIEPRVLVICPRCGIVGDWTRGRSLAISVGPSGLVRREGSVPGPHWAGRLRVECREEGASLSFPWLLDEAGSPVEVYQLPLVELAGPLVLSLILVDGMDIAIARAPYAPEMRGV